MKYWTVTNRANNPRRFFAETRERVIEFALEVGMVRKPESLRFVSSYEVDPDLFPHEGSACLRLAPGPRVYVASVKVDGEWVHHDQKSGELLPPPLKTDTNDQAGFA